MVLGSLLAAVLAGSWVTARGIEKDIDSRVTTALGQTGVQVVAAGRDIELAGAVADDPELEAAAGAAARVAGVRRVTSKGGVAPERRRARPRERRRRPADRLGDHRLPGQHGGGIAVRESLTDTDSSALVHR